LLILAVVLAGIMIFFAKVKELLEGGSHTRVQVCSIPLVQADPYTSFEPIFELFF
jgi:hypothetical protein